MYARKNRNPCIGELTHREDADFLMPFEIARPKKEPTVLTAAESQSINNKVRAKLQNSSDFEAIGLRKERIDSELKELRKVAAYNKFCLERMATGSI
jgi:hypothetical protein